MAALPQPPPSIVVVNTVADNGNANAPPPVGQAAAAVVWPNTRDSYELREVIGTTPVFCRPFRGTLFALLTHSLHYLSPPAQHGAGTRHLSLPRTPVDIIVFRLYISIIGGVRRHDTADESQRTMGCCRRRWFLEKTTVPSADEHRPDSRIPPDRHTPSTTVFARAMCSLSDHRVRPVPSIRWPPRLKIVRLSSPDERVGPFTFAAARTCRDRHVCPRDPAICESWKQEPCTFFEFFSLPRVFHPPILRLQRGSSQR